MANKLTTDMSRYIWHILSLDPYIPMSWGIDLESMESDDTSLEFHVQGFVHTGNVRITYIEGADVFQVTLYGEDGELKETINDVYLGSAELIFSHRQRVADVIPHSDEVD